MSGVLEILARVDAGLSDAVADLRWEPLTVMFFLASLWPMKGLVICGLGALGDVRSRRLRLPVAVWAASAAGVAAAATTLVKELFDRARPPVANPEFFAVVPVPESPSFPSGHASTAFAAATVVAMLHPRLRVPAFAVAALVAASRVYLGVHFTIDVVVGAALGAAIGAALVWAARRVEPLLTPA